MQIQKQKKYENILQFTAIILFLWLVNIYAERFFFRIDLTEEKRYSISAATIKLLKELDDEVYIEIYLEGELNTGFKRLQKSIRETLEEFRVYGGENIQYKFINPNQNSKPNLRKRFQQQLITKGIQATTLFDVVDGKKTQKVIFPGALIQYKHKETPVLLLKGNKISTAQQQLNQSIEGVEYEIASAIKKLTSRDKKSIALVQGHNEPSEEELSDLLKAINEYYILEKINLQKEDLKNYDAIILLSPKTKFSETEKFKIDQYIMKGGNALFLIDNIQMHSDSIYQGGSYAFAIELNLEDMLFKYGIKINPNLLQDRQAGLIDVFVGYIGDKPNIQKLPWSYYVYLNKFGNHPIVRHLDVVYAEYLSTLDTVKVKGIRKTPLLFSSKNSSIRNTPALIDLNELKKDRSYSHQYLPVAYLLEGSFQSLFATRFLPKELQNVSLLKQGENAKIIVMGNGNFLVQKRDKKTKRPIPINYDINRRKQLSNKDFIMNSLAYLTDEKGIITARNKQITLRLLDVPRVKEEKIYWQIFNLIIPVFTIIIFGMIRFYWRKRKYEKD